MLPLRSTWRKCLDLFFFRGKGAGSKWTFSILPSTQVPALKLDVCVRVPKLKLMLKRVLLVVSHTFWTSIEHFANNSYKILKLILLRIYFRGIASNLSMACRKCCSCRWGKLGISLSWRLADRHFMRSLSVVRLITQAHTYAVKIASFDLYLSSVASWDTTNYRSYGIGGAALASKALAS